jgi:hypothetical protein
MSGRPVAPDNVTLSSFAFPKGLPGGRAYRGQIQTASATGGTNRAISRNENFFGFCQSNAFSALVVAADFRLGVGVTGERV